MKSTTLRKLLSCSQKRFISRGSILRGSESPQSWAPGKELHGFRVDRVQEIPELQLTAIQMQHLKTGSLHLHLQKDADANSVFSVGFQTAPMDSTGVPHILEHVTLCGSKRYPVRDPFFKMLHRSIATYMNAWTASEYTLYPFATENHKDMENLRSVYMDAVFHPRLQRTDFLQEGWRLENSDLSDSSSPIHFKGVVYNEMKGALSDPGSLFCTRLQQHLYPECTYSFVSGGDPEAITELSYEQLVQFHRQHYHPSNAKFYTYGAYPLDKHLEFTNDIISQFEKIKPPVAELEPQLFKSLKRVTAYSPPDPVGDPQKQVKTCIAFLTNQVKDDYETFVMKIISSLLLDGQSSPMHRALIESGLGADYSAGTGYDSSTYRASFSVGLQGVAEKDVQKVEKIIRDTLDQMVDSGFDRKRIDAVIHQIELGIKHKTSNFGLGLAQNLMSGWMLGSDPIALLQINRKLDRLRTELEDPQCLQKRIEKYLVNNPHQLVFTMLPSDTYQSELNEKESKRLAKLTGKLTDNDKKRIWDDGKHLARLQDSKQDLSCLPTLKISDIARKGKPDNFCETKINAQFPVQMLQTETNEITYFRALVTVPSFPEELQPYVPLFTSALGYLGTTQRTASELDEEIRLFTGGIGSGSLVSSHHSNSQLLQQGFLFSGNCLDRNLSKMYSLLGEIVTSTRLSDKDRIKTLISISASSMMNSLAHNGHRFARSHAARVFSPAMSISEVHSGISQVQTLNRLTMAESMNTIAQAFESISDYIKTNGHVRLAVTTSEKMGKENEIQVAQFLDQTGFQAQSGKLTFYETDFSSMKNATRTWIPVPFSTSFVAKCIKAINYSHHDAITLQVLAQIMSQHYLHREIREKNGAYGGGASYSALDGVFSFTSYRDPNPLKTVSTFQKSAEWAASHTPTAEQMNEAKLSIFGSMDSPVSVRNDGMNYFKYQISENLRQQRRDMLFQVTPEQVRLAAEKYLMDQDVKSSITVMAQGNVPEAVQNSEWSVKQLGN